MGNSTVGAQKLKVLLVANPTCSGSPRSPHWAQFEAHTGSYSRLLTPHVPRGCRCLSSLREKGIAETPLNPKQQSGARICLFLDHPRSSSQQLLVPASSRGVLQDSHTTGSLVPRDRTRGHPASPSLGAGGEAQAGRRLPSLPSARSLSPGHGGAESRRLLSQEHALQADEEYSRVLNRLWK